MPKVIFMEQILGFAGLGNVFEAHLNRASNSKYISYWQTLGKAIRSTATPLR